MPRARTIALTLLVTLSLINGCGAEDPTPGAPAGGEGSYASLELPTAIHAGTHPGESAVEIVLSFTGETPALDGDPWTDTAAFEKKFEASRDHDHLFGVSERPVVIAADARLTWGECWQFQLISMLARAPYVSLVARREDGSVGTVPVHVQYLIEESPGASWISAGFTISLRRDGGVTAVDANDRRVPGGPLAEVEADLPGALAAIRTDKKTEVVRLEIDPDVTVSDVVRVLDLCRGSGLERFHIFERSKRFEVLLGYRSLGRRGSLEAWCAAPAATRRQVRLAVAKTAGAESNDGNDVFEVLLTAGGEIWCEGKKVRHRELRDTLWRHAEAVGREDAAPQGAKMGLLITADSRVLWQQVMWLTQDAADPMVRVYRIFWNLRTAEDGPEGQVRAFLPKDRGLARGRPGLPAADYRVTLVRDESSGSSHLYLARLGSDYKQMDLGAGAKGWKKLAKDLRYLQKRNAEARVEIEASPELPLAEVVRVVDSILGAGMTRFWFIGTPPPRPGD